MEEQANPYAAPQSQPMVAAAVGAVARAQLKPRIVSASRWLRFANLVIDQLMLVLIGFAAWLVCVVAAEDFGVTGGLEFLQSVHPVLLDIGLTFGYYLLLEATTSRTIGKLLTGTVVVNEKGGKPTVGQIARRSLARWIPFEAFSFFSQERRGFHDRLPGTYVVKARWRASAA
jgi:uncharacterized RDD family membrane protein YckC